MSETAPLPPALLDVHRLYNRNSARLWKDFGPHRARVTQLALDGGGERLAVLGAGNCNDLDLPALVARYREVHLVDIDEDALSKARDRQPPAVARALALHAPVDLSGALARLPGYAANPASAAELGALPGRCVEAIRAALPDTFDTVVDACLLSQIMHSCGIGLGVQHPQLEVIATAIGLGHLRAVAQLVRPGGRGILVTDTASASPDLPLESVPPLAALQYLQDHDGCLSGTSPKLLYQVLLTDPVVAPLVLPPPDLAEPWLWKMGPLTLLVYALQFRRR